MTPHINAKKGDIAKIVIMTGDPKRAEYIASNYLTDVKLVNEVRLALCYTGKYKDKMVSVMTSGMGMPSMGIYSYELYKFYDVIDIIRVGSCLSLREDIRLNDIVLSTSSYTSSNFAYNQSGIDTRLILPSLSLNKKIRQVSSILGYEIFEGRVITSDIFYNDFMNPEERNNDGVALEMETFALLYNAKIFNRRATSILTVSDSIYDEEKLTVEEREKSFRKAIEIALESIIL